MEKGCQGKNAWVEKKNEIGTGTSQFMSAEHESLENERKHLTTAD